LTHDVNMEFCITWRLVPVWLFVLARRFGHPTLQVLKKLVPELG